MLVASAGISPQCGGIETVLPRVIGHRGAAAYAPENTLAGFRKAKALGCHWVEFDVRLTGDSQPVLLHDDRLERTTNGRGGISGLQLAAVRRYDAGNWFHSSFAGERVPTLEEALLLLAELGLGANVELKAVRGREAATGAVVGELLGDLVERGLDFSQPRLYILDGGKALTAAVKKHAGESAAIQRCQVHKRRNVLDHLTDEQKPGVAKQLNAAYALEDYAAAKQALNVLHRELMDLNPSAARSLGEGMEETLTVHKLHLPIQLRKTMASTNVIESAFSIVEQVCRNVKRWHDGDQRERWVGSGLLVAEKQFRRVQGYKQIPILIRGLESVTPNTPAIAKRRRAS